MNKCIFSAHCTEVTCDKSCPVFVETSYLLERNNIDISSDVFKANKVSIKHSLNILKQADKQLRTVICDIYSTNDHAEMLTYCAICKNWRGSRLHCTVYHLRYSRYLDMLRASWGNNIPDELQYINIWIGTAQVLIISNLDYVNFGDFECQTLLNLLDSRASKKLTTIVTCPKLTKLISSKGSYMFKPLLNMLEIGTKVVDV